MKTNQDMNELVFKGQNGQVLTNSLLVAEKFGKRHVEVLDAIRDIIKKSKECASNPIDEHLEENYTFVENQQINTMFVLCENEIPMPVGNGVKKNPVYVMNRDGFTLLTMGFTGNKALKFKLDYIAAFNAMEKQLKALSTPQTYAEALRRLADEVEEKERAKALLEQKTEQLDESKEWFSIKRWAKEHGMNWRSINWRKMKALSYELGYEVKKVFDANYGQVNIYNVKVFEAYL